MKIVHVPRRFTRHTWGGTETVVLETTRRMLARGHDAEILSTMALADTPETTIGGVRVRRWPYFYPYWGLDREAKLRLDRKGGNLFSFGLLKALLDCPDLDLLHLHTGKRVGGIGRYAAMLRGIPYIVSLHGGVYDVPRAEVRGWTAPTRGTIEWGKALGWWVGSRRVFKDADAIICLGAREARAVSEHFPDRRVVRLPNGVDADRFARGDGARFRASWGIPSEAFVLLCVGRLDAQKNQAMLVEAMPTLLAQRPDFCAVLVGHITGAAYLRRLQRRIRDLGLERYVKLVPGIDGASASLVDAYHAADAFVLPSRHEPFGIVVLEAWAAGLPVIVSNVGGIRDLVADGVDGLLFEPHDICGLIAGVLAVRENPTWSRGLALAGRAKATEQYSWNSVTTTLLRLYETVIDEHRRRVPPAQPVSVARRAAAL